MFYILIYHVTNTSFFLWFNFYSKYSTWFAKRQYKNCFKHENFFSVCVWAWACLTVYVPRAEVVFDRTDGIETEFGIGLNPAAAAAAADAAAEQLFLKWKGQNAKINKLWSTVT